MAKLASGQDVPKRARPCTLLPAARVALATDGVRRRSRAQDLQIKTHPALTAMGLLISKALDALSTLSTQHTRVLMLGLDNVRRTHTKSKTPQMLIAVPSAPPSALP